MSRADLSGADHGPADAAAARRQPSGAAGAGGLPLPAAIGSRRGLRAAFARAPRLALRLPILAYRYSFSMLMGRQCRYLPTCSSYAEEAILRHGAWPGAFMAAARLCRCHPWGADGFDPVPDDLPPAGRWYAPWRYGVWRMPPGAGDGAEAGNSAPGP